MPYDFNIKIQSVSDEKTLEIQVSNHDDIINIIEKMKGNDTIGLSKQDRIEFALGLKLISEVVMKNRKNSLMKPFQHALTEVIPELKGKKKA